MRKAWIPVVLALLSPATVLAGYPSIFYAARANDLGIARYYVQSGEPVDIRDEYGVTPLMYAAEKGHAAMVEFLLEQGADPTASLDNGLTALGFTRSRAVRAILEKALSKRKGATGYPQPGK